MDMSAPLDDASPAAWLIWSDWLQDHPQHFWNKFWCTAQRIGTGLEVCNRLCLIGRLFSAYERLWLVRPGAGWVKFSELRWWTESYIRKTRTKTPQQFFDLELYLAQPADFSGLIEQNPRLAWSFFHTLAVKRPKTREQQC